MKRILRLSFRWLFRSVLFLIVFVGLYFLTAWICTFISLNEESDNVSGEVDLYVLSNGVHTDIVMPVQFNDRCWYDYFPLSDFEENDSSLQFISMGWGDKGFYLETPTWADLKFSTAFKAAFWMSTCAMHVTYREKAPVPGEKCKKIRVSKTVYETLCKAILSDFSLSNGDPMLIDHPGYGFTDRFYEARGTYNLFNTCNVWTGDKLSSAGIRVAPWTPFDWGVFSRL